jgi:uncharacterized protein YlxW (UPF0749 family)
MPNREVEEYIVRRSTGSQLLLTALTLVLGVAIVAQFRARGRAHVVTASHEDQSLLLSELVDANRSLRAEIDSLQSQLAIYEGMSRGIGLQELVAELNRVKVINGLVEVSGPGVELLVDGPLNVLDLQDLVNELRNAGAEAISLNGRRLVVHSVWGAEGNGRIMLDGYAISRPYRFQAIGDPDTLETALLRPGGLVRLFRRTYPNLMVTSAKNSRLVLGIRRPQSELRYAEPVD